MSSDENFARLLNRIDADMVIPASWLAPYLLKIAEETESRKLNHLINLILDPRLIEAKDLNIGRIKNLFSLQEEVVLWRLEEECYQVPQSLLGDLRGLGRLSYGTGSATRRTVVDFLLAACSLFLLNPHQGGAATPPPPKTRLPPRVFRGLDLSIEITDPASAKTVCVVGKADSALGYDSRETLKEDTFLGAIEIEDHESFSLAESHLLAHLAILRELRTRQRQTSTMVQGFFTDGGRYTFLSIRNDGTIQRSNVYEVDYMFKDGQPHLKTIFNFIVAILSTMRESMPHAAPAKAQQNPETD